MTKYFLLFSLFITITSSLSGKNLKLANTFSDGIVFQRDKPINIWGSANPNQSINLRFGNETKTAQSDDAGKWTITIGPLKASSKPRAMSIESEGNEIKIEDILVLSLIHI